MREANNRCDRNRRIYILVDVRVFVNGVLFWSQRNDWILVERQDADNQVSRWNLFLSSLFYNTTIFFSSFCCCALFFSFCIILFLVRVSFHRRIIFSLAHCLPALTYMNSFEFANIIYLQYHLVICIFDELPLIIS